MARSPTALRADAELHGADAPSASRPASVPASRRFRPSGGFFRALLIGLVLAVPFWVGVVWLLWRMF